MAEEDKSKKEEKYQVGKQILTHGDVCEPITVKGESFSVRFPLPTISEKIERDIALKLGGNPLDSFPATVYNAIRRNTTLDWVIEDSPEWWNSAGECYDEDLLAQLWDKYIEKRDTFRRCLQQNKFKRDS